MQGNYHILIADDHAVVRAGLRQFLVESGNVSDVAEAASGQQAMDLLRTKRFDLLILDINMPGRGGLDILKNVRASFPDTRVLIVSGFPENQYAVNVLKAGASGYLSKESAPEELLKAVQLVLAGRRYVSSALAEQLVADLDVDSDQPIHAALSEREFQILCKLAGGRAVSEIARELCLSVKTVSTYRSRVLEKMNLKSNADITRYALQNGLIQ
jgi:two-component system, NarL family, invasion response regulator UvrY